MVDNTAARLTLDRIHLLYPSSERVTAEELDGLQSELGAELPRGYREFMTRFGHGWINDWLQIYCPGRDLLREQRDSLVRRFCEWSSEGLVNFVGARLEAGDMRASVQMGINQGRTLLFACPRFPGSVFQWEDLDITQHAAGIEVLDPFAGMRMDRFAYMFPLKPFPEFRRFASRSARLEVHEVVRAIQDRYAGPAQVIDVDEGPQGRSPAFWLFPEKLGAMLWVYLVKREKTRRIYLTFGTSPGLLSKVDALVSDVVSHLGVKFTPAKPC